MSTNNKRRHLSKYRCLYAQMHVHRQQLDNGCFTTLKVPSMYQCLAVLKRHNICDVVKIMWHWLSSTLSAAKKSGGIFDLTKVNDKSCASAGQWQRLWWFTAWARLIVLHVAVMDMVWGRYRLWLSLLWLSRFVAVMDLVIIDLHVAVMDMVWAVIV